MNIRVLFLIIALFFSVQSCSANAEKAYIEKNLEISIVEIMPYNVVNEIVFFRFSIKNNGPKVLDKIVLNVFFLDEQGKVILKKEHIAIDAKDIKTQTQPLSPGHTFELQDHQYRGIEIILPSWKSENMKLQVSKIEFGKDLTEAEIEASFKEGKIIQENRERQRKLNNAVKDAKYRISEENYKEALLIYKQALKKYPGTKEYEDKIEELEIKILDEEIKEDFYKARELISQEKYGEALELNRLLYKRHPKSSDVIEDIEWLEKKFQTQEEKDVYISEKIKLFDVKAKYSEVSSDRDPLFCFSFKNTGDRVLSKVYVTAYFLDEHNKVVYKETVTPIKIGNFSKPLKPGEVFTGDPYNCYGISTNPASWQEGNVEIKVTDIEFYD